MDLSHPAPALFGDNEARVLYRLAVLADGASGRRIHRLAGVKALRTTQQILERLVHMGLVDVRTVGSANQYLLNRGHILWDPIEQVLATPARLEGKIAEILSDTFAGSMAGAALYGSFARGEANSDSDIDILVVWEGDAPPGGRVELIDEASERIHRLTGNPAHILAITRAEIDALVDVDEPLVESLRDDARALTNGLEIAQLLRKKRE